MSFIFMIKMADLGGALLKNPRLANKRQPTVHSGEKETHQTILELIGR